MLSAIPSSASPIRCISVNRGCRCLTISRYHAFCFLPRVVLGLGAIVGACACAAAIVFHAGVSVVCLCRDVSSIGSRADVCSTGIDILDAGVVRSSFAMFWLSVGEVLEGVGRRVGIARLRMLLIWKRWRSVTAIASETRGSEGTLG